LIVGLRFLLSIDYSILLLLLLFWLYSPLLGLGRFFSFLILYTVGMTPWTGDQPVARPLPAHRTTTTQTQSKRTQYRHPCLEWDSNPGSQRLSERRQFMP
jgi:fatty acid desaturase